MNKYSTTKRTHLYCKWANSKFSILLSHFIILFILFCPSINQFLFLTWKYLRNFLPGLAWIIDYMSYFQPVYIEWKFSYVCSNRGEIYAWFTVMKFLYIIVILFLHFSCLSCEIKSHQDLMSWNFSPGWKPSYKHPRRLRFFQK